MLALDEKQAAQLRGPRADPAAHLLLRPYLKRAVYVGLADPGEGVPYWLVATRHPEELAAAIEARHAAGAARQAAWDRQRGQAAQERDGHATAAQATGSPWDDDAQSGQS